MEQVFFTNSGTEAIEGAIKIAKKYHFLKHNNHNGEIIAMKKSFHGRSMGALSITGKAAYQEPFAPMLAHVKFRFLYKGIIINHNKNRANLH